MTELAALTVAEADCLADCEQRIERGLKTFVEVGTALATIRDNRLYRAEFGTFEVYCQERWGFTDRRARQIMEAAEIGRILPVTNAGQAAELARVPEPERADIWRATIEATGGRPTAAAIRGTYRRTQTAASPTEPSDRACEACGETLPDDQAKVGYLRCDSCDPDGDHYAAGFPDGTGACVTCHGRPEETPAITPEPDPEASTSTGSGPHTPARQDPDPVGPSVATTGGPVPVGPAAAFPPPPARTKPVDPIDDPEFIRQQRRRTSSEGVAKGLVALHLALETDPLHWLAETWQRDAYRERDLPRVRDAFTASGLRAIAKNLDTLADHLDRTGGSL